MFLFGLCAHLAAAASQQAAPSIFNPNAPVPVPQEILPPPPVSGLPSEPSNMPQAFYPVEDVLKTMSLEARVGQLMLVTMDGLHAPTTEDLAFVRRYVPGGVVIRQLLQPAHAVDYVTKLRAVEKASGIPLWIGADVFELVRRDRAAPSAFIQLPSLLSIAASGDDATIDRLGQLLAQHLHLMGFNLHLGPSLSLAPTIPDANGTIYTFGSDPGFVASAGGRLIGALRANQVLPVPMGFPGGGNNRSKGTPAALLTPRPLLLQQDAAPYVEVLKTSPSMLHVGTMLVPTLDSQSMPACVSRVVLQDLLRGEMGFTGVAIAGPMDSEAVATLLDPAEAAIQALQHGANMVYWRSAGSTVKRAVDHIVAAVEQGRLDPAGIEASVRRILTVKSLNSLESPGQAMKDKDIRALEKERTLAKEVMAIERRSITLLQHRNGVLPLSKERGMPLGVTGVVALEDFKSALEKYTKKVSAHNIGSAKHFRDIEDFELDRITRNMKGLRTLVCVLTSGIRPEGGIKLVRAAKATGANVVVVLLGYPELAARLTEADAILLAYCDEANYQQSLNAVADVLMGEGALGIPALPEALKARVGEARTFNALEVCRLPAGRLPIALGTAFAAGTSLSLDPSTAIKKVRWDFGDGKDNNGLQVQYAYKQAGQFSVTLSVVDTKGETAVQTFKVEVTE